MKNRTIVILGLGYVAGCAVRPAPEGSSGSSGGSTSAGEAGETSGVPTTGGAGGTSTSTGSGTGGATGTTGSTGPDLTTGGDTCDFVCESTGGDTGGFAQCDLFKQDCPEGEKCSAYAEGGGSSWNATGCVPVGGDGQPGEPCTVQGGGTSGLDDCAKGVMCWGVDETDHGTCVALCTGTEAAPVCSDEENFKCATCDDCLLTLCLPACDPLSQDCAGGGLCMPVGDTFVCVFDASGDEGQVLDPCEFANTCDAGLLCLHSSAATECDDNSAGCCLPFCDVTDPNVVCPGVGQACVSLYEEGMAPPKYEKVGICMLP